MRFKIYIALLVCSLYSVLYTPLQAVSVEQEQQFTYYWYAARNAIDNERYPDAYVLLQFCNALKPDDAQTLYYLGVMHTALHHEEQASACFEQAYAADPNNASEDLLERLKGLYISRQEWKKALAIQDRLDARNEYDAFSALTRYRIYAMAGQPKKAIKAIDDYLQVDPDDVRFLLFRIELMEQTGAKKKALYAMYERVLALDPHNATVLNNYAYHLATHGGDLNKAERMSSLATSIQPDNAVFLDTYGWIMHLKGQDELAKFYLNKALWNAKSEDNKTVIKNHLEAIK